MSKSSKVTLRAARKALAVAYKKADEGVGIYGKACLGHRVSNLECGNRYRKERAVSRARAVVDKMEELGVQFLDRVTVRDGDEGLVTFYLHGNDVVLTHFSSADRFGLGPWVEAQLAAFLAERRKQS